VILWRFLLVLALATVALAPAAASVSARATSTHRLVPSAGALLGAYVDDTGTWVDDATAEAGVKRLEGQLGRTLDVDHHYYAWTDRFPTGLERWDVDGARIPMISWGGSRLADILSGRFDGMIRERARGVKALGAAVFLRWGWEMNGNWSSHDGSHNNAAGTTSGPRAYIAAWRRIHDIFKEEGASNAVWVWSPNAADVPAVSWNHWTKYYPGDAYVDWVGIDGYNWGTTQPWSSWTSFASLVQPVYSDYAGRKPIMIAETASTEQGGNKADWLTGAAIAMKSRFPSLRALVYFDTDKETNWSVDSSPAALRAFRALGADPYFAPRAARLLSAAAPPARRTGPIGHTPAAGIE
jgi:Glycosyl hydrolase family 26